MVVLVAMFLCFAACGAPEQYHHESEAAPGLSGIEIYLPANTIETGAQVQARVLMIHSTGVKSFAEDGAVAWRTDDGDTIRIDETGLITALAAGRSTINATVGDLTSNAAIDVRQAIDYTKLAISEVLIQPQGSVNAEFIELYNANEYECDISGLLVVDGGSTSAKFSLPDGTTIAPAGRLVIAKNEEQFMIEFFHKPDCDGFTFGLNDTGESVFLLKPDGTIIDCVYIKGGTSFYPPPSGWDPVNQPSPAKGSSVHRIGAIDTDTAADWTIGTPSPGW